MPFVRWARKTLTFDFALTLLFWRTRCLGAPARALSLDATRLRDIVKSALRICFRSLPRTGACNINREGNIFRCKDAIWPKWAEWNVFFLKKKYICCNYSVHPAKTRRKEKTILKIVKKKKKEHGKQLLFGPGNPARGSVISVVAWRRQIKTTTLRK